MTGPSSRAPQDDMFDGFRSVSMVSARFIHSITHTKRLTTLGWLRGVVGVIASPEILIFQSSESEDAHVLNATR